ncbi:PIN domain-like protein [Scleroderma citrinum]
MGISGLLTTLKSIQVTRHLSDFAGQTLAVDAYVWLHRGIYTCATELATGKSTVRYVDYAMQRIRLLRHHSIQPYVVFDGGPLPAKLETESGRRKRREENLAKAKTLTAEGKKSQAREFYAKCVDVTPQMAYQLIKALRAEGVQYVVAPYEADAQMAYLERKGLVDGIITEDSDLLVFGCRNVLFKFDCASSTVVNIRRADFGSVTVADGGISLAGWTDGQFRAMAILSGCDYLPSIPGIGLKTAWSLLRKHRSVEQVLRTLRLDGKKSVPKGYLDAFQLAEKVFLYQRVYCPLEERLVTLTESSAEQKYDAEMEAYIGRGR